MPETVDKTLQQPLPEPVETIVKQTPVGGVRDTVRDTARGVVQPPDTGSGSSGSTGAGTAPAAPAGDQSAVSDGGGAPSAQTGDRSGGGRAPARGGDTPTASSAPAAQEPATGPSTAVRPQRRRSPPPPRPGRCAA